MEDKRNEDSKKALKVLINIHTARDENNLNR